MGFCNCYMFCCTFLYVPSSFATILMGKRGLVALLSLSSWCLVVAVCFVALHPKSTAMVMAGRSVQLITLFPGQA